MSDDPKPQIDKFKELARELEADEDEEHFEETVRKIAPKPRPAGKWEVVPLKTGGGYYARFTPDGYGPTENGPEFATEAEAQGWADEQARGA